jgi:tetratricopeptide (TPR) repeat protein
VFFNDAISYKPDFASARIFHLELLIEGKRYNEALVEIVAILNNSYLNIWYIHYLNAKILYHMNEYAKALTILEGPCSNFNKNCFEQYMLMGDCYQALNKCTEAGKNYTEAGKLRRDDPDYKAKIIVHHEKCKQ